MTALADKVGIVTGASSGIGHATARLFAREGARVVVTARPQAELDALVASIEEEGGHAIAVAGDIRDEALAKLLVETAGSRRRHRSAPSPECCDPDRRCSRPFACRR
jgi:NADP-dependent 3-hydroxy acid dehydrogenase YdfG